MKDKRIQIPFFIILFIILIFSLCYQKENPQLKTEIKNFKINEESIMQKDIHLEIQDNYLENFNIILQNPQLPTGCEITSLTMVLNYLGYDVTKTEMVNYMPIGQYGRDNFYTHFIGSPYSIHGFGCYVEALINTAQAFDDQLNVINLTGRQLQELNNYINLGHPIIIWVTIDMMNGYPTYSWEADGQTVTWIANQHCVVLIGYNLERQVYIVADPLRGQIEYNTQLLRSRYELLGSQALIIYR